VSSHVGAALKHGHVAHAAKHASTAAVIGEAERQKHESGPLPVGAHAAPGADTTTADGETSHVASANASSGAGSSSTSTSGSTGPTLGEKASTAASNLGAQASAAASNLSAQASTAASNLSDKASAAATSIKASASDAASKASSQASDAASFAGAAISQGHPVHAAQYAGTAAMIGQVEKEKHAAGPLEDERDIAKVHGH